MTIDSIRHLAIAEQAPRIAVARFETDVAIWDLESYQRVSAFETVLDFGGHRLAMSPDGARCLAAAYHRHGVACYGSEDGRLLWQRRDIKKVQYLTMSPDGTRVFCGVANGPCVVLDAATGEVLERLRGVISIACSRFAPVYLAQCRSYQLRGDFGVTLARIPRESFALLDVAFGTQLVCLSEAGGPVRAFDVLKGRECWRYSPPRGHHVLHLGFRDDGADFLGIQWNYESGGPYELWRWGSDGSSTLVFSTPAVATAAFCRAGEALLLADGRLIETRTGGLAGEIPFDRTPW